MADDLAAIRAEAQARYHIDKGAAEAAHEAERELMAATWSVRTCAEDVLTNADREPGVADRAAYLTAAYEALDAVIKLLENIKKNPTNERFRTLRTTNERLQQNMYAHAMARDLVRSRSMALACAMLTHRHRVACASQVPWSCSSRLASFRYVSAASSCCRNAFELTRVVGLAPAWR